MGDDKTSKAEQHPSEHHPEDTPRSPVLSHQYCEPSYNMALVNRYLDGNASIGWHSDAEKWYSGSGHSVDNNNDMIIGSVSIGAPRWFEMRTSKTRAARAAQTIAKKDRK